MKEIWKDIEGYEGYYQVSNLGRVRSLDRKSTRESTNLYGKYKCTHIRRGVILSPQINPDGYKRVPLYKKRVMSQKKISRLVAKAFIPNPKNKPQVNHIDGNKLNDSSKNLEWCTRRENEIHAVINGLKANGEKNGNSKMCRKSVISIRDVYKTSNYTLEDLADRHNVTRQCIWLIVHNKTWKHI